ncbi:hypothetical protein MNB_SUP05-4-898 [hydrothermal vent metagenome]|uniref:Uncharacterized protein n=1 Tax=hydrothermal vent metagenome TaxID=652676 RepID=A0A1W1DBA6_9ZZZZ
MHHTNMNHAAMMGNNTADAPVVLTESGTDPFATLQEVIAALEANPGTNWERVNIEALRLHLVEMQDMTINVDVKQQDINNGFQAVVTPTTNRAVKSITRVLSGHPVQMKAETGWDMQVSNNDDVFTLTVVSKKAHEVAKIRGLGYIGVMAYGNHHQPHHWAMASGENPHATLNMRH